MERVPESEFMETKEQVLSYAAADFLESEENLIKVISTYLEVNKINLTNEDLIIDLGCGPGNISEKLSLKWPHTSVIGIDGSKEMILKAKSQKNRNNKKNIFNNLSYVLADIKKIQLSDITSKNKLTLLVSNSLIHHITHLDDFFNSIINLSTTDTVNFHKDLIRPINEESALELKLECASKYNDILTNDYYASLKAAYRKDELEKIILDKELPHLRVIEENEKYLIVYGKV